MRNYSGTVSVCLSVGGSDGADGSGRGAARSRVFNQRSGKVLSNRVLATVHVLPRTNALCSV
jgi:hypothetical protein